jgi:membrane-bound metal-dependent hydrolase YbcI (DUF457 family)
MALPIAHGLVGATIGALLIPEEARKAKLKTIVTAAAVAILPDLDYVFYRVLGWGESWHRSFSHSIVFALAAGAMASIVVGPRRIRWFLIYSLATLSHPVLDALVSEQGGVQFLWPWSERMFHFGVIAYPSVFEGNSGLHSVVNRIVKYSLVEVMVFAPLLVFVLGFKSRRDLDRGSGVSPESSAIPIDRVEGGLKKTK